MHLLYLEFQGERGVIPGFRTRQDPARKVAVARDCGPVGLAHMWPLAVKAGPAGCVLDAGSPGGTCLSLGGRDCAEQSGCSRVSPGSEALVCQS